MFLFVCFVFLKPANVISLTALDELWEYSNCLSLFLCPKHFKMNEWVEDDSREKSDISHFKIHLSSPFASCLFIFGSSILIKQVLGLKFEQQLSGQLITEH